MLKRPESQPPTARVTWWTSSCAIVVTLRWRTRIRNLKDCGLERMPFSVLAANAAWMELVLTETDQLVWCQQIRLDGDLARAEPRTLRYRLLHTAGRLMHRSRQVLLRLLEHWPWAKDSLWPTSGWPCSTSDTTAPGLKGATSPLQASRHPMAKHPRGPIHAKCI